MPIPNKPDGHFRGGHWVDDHQAVEFTLELSDDRSSSEYCCRISGEALYDAAGQRGPISGDEAFKLFQRFRSRVHAEVDMKLSAGNFNYTDKLIIIESLAPW